MTIFLLILKIIGIVLAVILAVVALILFVPLCYELDADIDEKTCFARVKWFGRLIRFEFRWKEKAHAVLHLLWFTIDFTDPEAVAARKKKKEEKARKKQRKQQKKEKQKREKEQRKREKEKQQAEEDRDMRAQNREEFHRQEEEQSEISNGTEKDIERKEMHAASGELAESGCTTVHKTQTDADTVTESLQEGLSGEVADTSIIEKWSNLREKANSVTDKVRSGISVIRFLREEELIPAIWSKLKLFLLHIRPRVLRGNLIFGLSDPADTGQITGALAMIPFLYETELQITPDFEAEENYIRGQVYTKGHMCCIHLLILVIRLLRDERIRGVIRTIRGKN